MTRVKTLCVIANSVDPDHEQSNQDLHCMHMLFFFSEILMYDILGHLLFPKYSDIHV